MPTSPSDDVSALLEEFLVRLITVSDAESMDNFATTELSLAQIRVLFTLAHLPGAVPISEVAQRLGMSLATAGRNLDRLVHEQLVDRQEDPDDRRVKRVALSTRGSQLLAHHLDCRREGLRAFTDRLSPDERQGLRAALIPILQGSSLPGTDQGTCR